MNDRNRTRFSAHSTAALHAGRHLLLGAAVALVLTGSAMAQGFGRISGSVTDATGAVIPGATVIATQAGTGAKTEVKANDSGDFIFPSLAPSTYNLSVTAPGFNGYQQNGILLQADAAVSQNVTLKTGDSNTTITVTGDALQVDTTTGTLPRSSTPPASTNCR